MKLLQGSAPWGGAFTGYSMGVEVRGNVVFSALQSTEDFHLYFLSPPTPATLSWLPEQALFPPVPGSLGRWTELPGLPEHPQPSGNSNWYQDLSLHIPLPLNPQEGPRIVSTLVPPFLSLAELVDPALCHCCRTVRSSAGQT